MTDVEKEIKKTNAAIQETEIELPFFIANTDWRAEFYDGVNWCEGEWRKGCHRLGVMLCVVMILFAAAGFLWALITH